MKKIVTGFVLALFIFSGCSLLTKKDKVPVKDTGEEATVETMKITAAGFQPKTLSIAAGAKVVFFNEDETEHQVSVAEQAGIPLQKGQSWTYTFESAGTFTVKDIANDAFSAQIQVN